MTLPIATSKPSISIGIVGGGPGGLLSAWLLQNALDEPVRITILEASARLGGKVLTQVFDRVPIRYEVGAAELYDYSHLGEDPLRELIARFGLATVPMTGHAVIAEGALITNQDDVRDHLGASGLEALCAFDRRARDQMSPCEFFEAGSEGSLGPAQPNARFEELLQTIPDRATRAHVSTLIHSDLATEPSQTSVEYGLQNYLMNDAKYLRLYSIEGGNEKLIDALATRVAATVKLRTAVRAIGRGDSGRLRVETRSASHTETAEFDYLVLALPLNHLRQLHFDGASLQLAMQKHIQSFDHPAHYLRISVLFERPFWRTHWKESYCMLDAFGGCCLYDESARDPEPQYGVLGWLLGGSTAEEMSALSDAELIEHALASLPFDVELARELLLEGRVHRWLDAVNAIPGGLEPKTMAMRHQPEPAEHARLFVVGDYLFDSTLNGVLDSAEQVSEWIASEIAASCAIRQDVESSGLCGTEKH